MLWYGVYTTCRIDGRVQNLQCYLGCAKDAGDGIVHVGNHYLDILWIFTNTHIMYFQGLLFWTSRKLLLRHLRIHQYLRLLACSIQEWHTHVSATSP